MHRYIVLTRRLLLFHNPFQDLANNACTPHVFNLGNIPKIIITSFIILCVGNPTYHGQGQNNQDVEIAFILGASLVTRVLLSCGT